MEITKVVKGIVKGYFFGAMALSATHTVHTFEKLGLNTGEQYITPLAIDGIAFLGLILRGERWSSSTRKTGMRVQIGAGAAQLVANVYAASSAGGMVLGVMTVGLYLLAEFLSDRMETRESELARTAAAEAEIAAKIEAEKAEADRLRKNEAARNRRQATAAKHAAETKTPARRTRTLKAV